MSRAIIFAHFDPDGMVDAHILHSLRQYRLHFQRMIFVTTVAVKNRQYVLPLVDDLIERQNEGLDFYSWKTGLQTLSSPTDYFEVVFCNDSIYGPVHDLGGALSSPAVEDADLWGMSLSWQIKPHIQSYFFGMRRRLFADGIAQSFWQTVDALPDKNAIIETYEVNMMNWFQRRGCRAATLYRPAEGDLRNPTVGMWRELLLAGVPYVKVHLLRLFSNARDVEEILGYIRQTSTYPTALIENHLLRISAPGRGPNAESPK